jgi:hypothetical protein
MYLNYSHEIEMKQIHDVPIFYNEYIKYHIKYMWNDYSFLINMWRNRIFNSQLIYSSNRKY